MTPTAVIAIVFADGSVGRMQYYGKDTSDEAILAEIARSSFAQPAVSWVRAAPENFPAKGSGGWVMSGDRLVASNPPRAKTEIEMLKERVAAIESDRANRDIIP